MTTRRPFCMTSYLIDGLYDHSNGKQHNSSQKELYIVIKQKTVILIT